MNAHQRNYVWPYLNSILVLKIYFRDLGKNEWGRKIKRQKYFLCLHLFIFFDFLLHTHIYIKRLTEGMTEYKTQNISFLTLRGHHGDPPRMKF